MTGALTVAWSNLSLLGALYARAEKAGMIHIPLLLMLALSFFFLGTRLLRRLGLAWDSTPETVCFSYGLGLLLVSNATFLLGVVGLLYPWLFRTLTLLLFLFLAGDYRRAFRQRRRWVADRPFVPDRAFFRSHRFEFALVLTLAAFIFFYLVAALAPEVEFDALNYHLGVLSLYRSQHQITSVPTHYYSGFPFGMEMIYLFAWLVKDPHLAKLFHFLSGIWVLVAIYAFCRRYLSSKLGLLAGAIFYTAPIVGWESGTAYVDITLTAYTFLCVYAILNWHATGRAGWFYLSAIFCGAAAAAKYTGMASGLLAVPVIVHRIMTTAEARGRAVRRATLKLLLFATVALAVFSPWLIKNYIFTKNPFHPFLTRFFPNPYMSAEDEALWVYIMSHHWDGFTSRFVAYRFSTLLWDVAVRGKYNSTIGPIFVFFVPALCAALYGARRKSSAFAVLWTGLLGVLAFTVWGLVSPQVRFAITFLPYFSIVMAWALYRLKRPALASSLRVLVLVLFVMNAPFLIMKWHRRWLYVLQDLPFSVVFGGQSREDYVTAHHPARPAFDYINRRLPTGAALFTLNLPYQFFTDRPLICPNTSRIGTILGDSLYEAVNFSPHKKVTLRLSGSTLTRFIRLRQTGSDPSHGWSIHDLRLFAPGEGPAEIPRTRWKTTSNYNPQETLWAVDARRLTAWASQSPQRADMIFELDLGASYAVQDVVYRTSATEWGRRHQVEISMDGRRWSAVDVSEDVQEAMADLSLTDALENLKRHGISYLLLQVDRDPFYFPLIKALESKPAGIELLFDQNDVRLYRL